MMTQMHRRTKSLALRMSAVMLLVALLGVSLALLIRKEQSLDESLGYRVKITNNLSLMRADTRLLKEQLAVFHQQLRPDAQRRSSDMQLFLRLDQIKETLKPIEMNVTPVESKDGTTSVGFTLKLPLASYETAVNAMGRLQSEHSPFVLFKVASFNAMPGTDFTVEGSVFMPKPAGGQP